MATESKIRFYDNIPNRALKTVRSSVTLLRSQQGKRVIVNHIIPITIYIILAVIIYRNLVGAEGVIANADLTKPPERGRFFQFYYPLWSEYESITTLSRLPQLLLYLPFFALGGLLDWNTTELLVSLFIFSEAFAGISMYYSSRYLLKRTYIDHQWEIVIAAFFAGLAYMWSSYLIFRLFHPVIRAAYAFAPLLIITLIVGYERNKIRYVILTGFLWCLISADIHWVIYGAILLLGFTGYHILLDLCLTASKSKVRTFGKSLFHHLKFTAVLIGSFVCFSAYWFVPGLFMGSTSRYGSPLVVENLENTYSRSTILEMSNKQGEHFTSQEIFATNSEFLGSSAVNDALFLLRFAIFLFGMMALILRPRNRYVVYFSMLALFSLFLATTFNFAPEVGFWIIYEAPLHGSYGWVLKTPKISALIILSLCFLMGFSLVEILSRIGGSDYGMNMKKLGALSIFTLLLVSIILPNWPLATGDMNTLLSPADMPDEFSQANSWIESQPGDFKVLWLPDYNSRDVSWNKDHRTNKDIAGLSSSRPTYIFDTPQRQPSRYGENFLSSTVQPKSRSILYDNATDSIGKILAPLGIKYVLFHDDNAVKPESRDVLLGNIHNQADLELVERFGIISIYENTHYDEKEIFRLSTSSRDFLVSGGLRYYATLNSIPYYQSRGNGIIFGNQRHLDFSDLDSLAEGIILTRSSGLEEITFTFVDDEYLIAPYDFTNHYLPGEMWSKLDMKSNLVQQIQSKAKLITWDLDYDRGIVFTWSPGTIKDGTQLGEDDIIERYDFETDHEGFTTTTSDLSLSLSNNSAAGQKSLEGTLIRNESKMDHIAYSNLIQLPQGSNYYRASALIRAENASNVQVKVKFYDGDINNVGREFLDTLSGTFDYRRIQRDFQIPPNSAYCNFQIIANQNAISESHWWVDDITLYHMENVIKPNRIDMDFHVDSSGEYRLYMRNLKSEEGGLINLYLDDEVVDSINTYDIANTFSWEYIGSARLSRGTHTVSMDNVAGVNAVNLIAAIPERKMDEYLSKTERFVQERILIYTLEAEIGFDYENAEISHHFGNSASQGGVVQLMNNGGAWMPIEILKDGDYSLSMRVRGDSRYSSLNISLGDVTYDIECNQGGVFEWLNLSAIPLTAGLHEMGISKARNEITLINPSFEDGWDSRYGAPFSWSPPREHHSALLDSGNSTNGDYSLRLTTDTSGVNNWSNVLSQEIELEPDEQYEIGIDIRAENINGINALIIGYNNTLGRWKRIDNLVPTLDGTFEWTRYKKSFYLADDVSMIQVVLNAGGVLNTSRGNATTWFDNLKLRPELEHKNIDIDLVVLHTSENNQTLEQLFNTSQVASVVDYKKIDSTRYEVRIISTGPFTLGFTEAYDEFWVAHVGDSGEIKSLPLYGVINGFHIDKSGNFTVTIEYKPQQWFDAGATITSASIVGSLGFFVWVDRRLWGDRLNGLYTRLLGYVRRSSGNKK